MKDGGCCVARYGGAGGGGGGGFMGGGGGGGQSASQVDQIMLRFRPIAPKPSNSCRPEYAPAPAPARTKRRGGARDVTSRLARSRSRRKLAAAAAVVVGAGDVGPPALPVAPVSAPVTLPLLPEAPEPKGSGSDRDSSPSSTLEVVDSWPPQPQVVRAALAAQAFLTVERVVVGAQPPQSGEEYCPTFVTDQWYSVLGYNDAFWQLICADTDGSGNGRVLVALIPKEKLPGADQVQAFTCRVRVQVAMGAKEKPSLTVPCDVWRMEGGGWTWRLDIKAALSLGR